MNRHLLFVLMLCLPMVALAQSPVPLYPEGHGAEKRVAITPFVAPGATTAVVVCPGGSYFWLDYKGEGVEVARWLQSNGISAFVLQYRVPGWWAWATHYRYIVRGVRYPDMYNDGQQALQWVVDHAAQYGIDTNRIGMMGFSAGGHLVMSQAVLSGGRKPAFVAPIYPVVTMSDDCVHRRSRRGLLGEWGRFDTQLRDSLSIERHIPDDCPPVFSINCHDDPVVHYHNAELLDSALTAHHIPHRYIQYSAGKHGFGVSEAYGTPESRQWKQEFLQWLNTILVKS